VPASEFNEISFTVEVLERKLGEVCGQEEASELNLICENLKTKRKQEQEGAGSHC